MKITKKKISLKKGLKIWKESKSLKPAQENHLSVQEIARLIEPGEINNAPVLLEHLSLCPICLEKWAAAGKAKVSQVEEDVVTWSDDYIAYGMLEAASSKTIDKPIISASSIGKFSLGVYPDQDDPDKVLLTLDVEQEMRAEFEGKKVTVRGKNGEIFLQGVFQDGQIARICRGLVSSDFSEWTVIVQRENND